MHPLIDSKAVELIRSIGNGPVGLEIRRNSAPQCCCKPEGAAHMIESIQTRLMVHVCTGCSGQAAAKLPKGCGPEDLMLPQLVERAVKLERA